MFEKIPGNVTKVGSSFPYFRNEIMARRLNVYKLKIWKAFV